MSATNVTRAGKRGNICVGNNVSATMCPQQCVLVCQGLHVRLTVLIEIEHVAHRM